MDVTASRPPFPFRSIVVRIIGCLFKARSRNAPPQLAEQVASGFAPSRISTRRYAPGNICLVNSRSSAPRSPYFINADFYGPADSAKRADHRSRAIIYTALECSARIIVRASRPIRKSLLIEKGIGSAGIANLFGREHPVAGSRRLPVEQTGAASNMNRRGRTHTARAE